MFFSTTTALILLTLAALTTTSPLTHPILTSRTTTPSPTYPNGTTNPFYPCGTTPAEITSCPYRCYTVTGSLLPGCFSQSSATAAINALQSICVQCIVPDPAEDQPSSCQPLGAYFSGLRPSRCGFETDQIGNCSWNCNSAQVPFSQCDGQNTTGPFRICQRCQPQCSSPRIVFQPDSLPSNFSIAAGSCSVQYGPQQMVACPYRCRDAGNPNLYCSLADQTVPNGFTTCDKCD